MKNLLSILKMDFVKTNRTGKNLRSFSCLLCCLILVLGSSFQSLAVISSSSNAFVVNPDYLIGSASNADPYGIATMELTDDDYYIQPFSTLGTVSNTIGDGAFLTVTYFDKSSESYRNARADVSFTGNRFHVSFDAPSNTSIYQLMFRVPASSLPSPGTYNLSFDYSSDFAYDYISESGLIFNKYPKNASQTRVVLRPSLSTFSGDIYLSPYKLNLASFSGRDFMEIFASVSVSDNITQLGGSFAIHFEKVANDSSAPSTGPDYSSEDYEADVSGSLSDISSSIGDMSSSMDSASESLEYISTSQNLIIQGIDNVIMHISDQLYAFWDQLYNLIHEPTYARLEQILLALKAIANNSDISAVVDTIEETTQQQIANDNANTGKVESAVEKHGNFIIEGLKSLFIPSDEYFKSYFDDLYGYFSDRFGFLSFPIDLLVRLIDLFVNAADRDCILTLPDFEISGQPLISEASFNLTEFLERDFAILLSSIRLVTSIGLIIAFVHLCQDKWNEVMRN